MPELKPCRAPNLKHGAYARNKHLYGVWTTMKHRCENPKREKFKDYGARGIDVCEEWNDPNRFIDWALENGYESGLQIDRIDNNKGYSPDNCRWVSPKTNSRNRRNTVYVIVDGAKKSAVEWAEITGISQYTIYWWVREKGTEYAEKRIKDRIA